MKGLDPDLRALQEVRDLVARAKAALEQAHGWDQARTDRVCAAMAKAGAAAAHDLARLAVEETGIGRVHYKVLKNLFGAEGTWESIRDERTVGVVRRDEATGVVEVATPVGVVAAVIPTTNLCHERPITYKQNTITPARCNRIMGYHQNGCFTLLTYHFKSGK